MNNIICYNSALGGVISALCLMLMFMTSLSPLLYLVMPMLAGLLLIAMIEEAGTGQALLTYAAVSILSMMVTFNKESALMFIMFFGYYPIAKVYIDKVKPKLIRNLIKLTLYNVCIISEFLIAIYLFGITDMIDEMNDMGKYGLLAMLGLSNVTFLVYDNAVISCTKLYKRWFRPKILCKK